MVTSPDCNIAGHLSRMAAESPDQPALFAPQGLDGQGGIQYERWSFRQLEEESNRLANALASVGIGPGVRTVLMVKPGVEFFALTFALFKLGAVPVLIDPGMGVANLGQCIAEADPRAFIGIRKAHVARLLYGWGRKSLQVNVLVGGRWFPGAISLAGIRAAHQEATVHEMGRVRDDDLAAILFTSGSTGVPKGAVYTHGIFASQVDLLQRTYDIQPGEIDLPTFPLFALFAPALGMTAIIPEMDFTRPGEVEPRNVIEPIQRFGVTNLFGSPALLNRVGRYGKESGIQLPSLRRVISAGAPVAAEVLERFATMLPPNVQIFTPYGATEALPVSSLGSDEILGETCRATARGAGVCVGRPVPGITVRFMKIMDDPVAEWSDELLEKPGAIGEIVVQGPVVTHAYFNRSAATALAKIREPATGAILHRMGDLGYLDDAGRIWFCGRKSQRVVTSEGTLFTIPCEAIFNQHPRVARSALVSVPTRTGTIPVICVELEKDRSITDRPRFFEELRALAVQQPHTRGIEHFLIHPRFPVDVRHNAKIGREQLAKWAARHLT